MTSYSPRVLARAWEMTRADVGLKEVRPAVASLLWTAVTFVILWGTGAVQEIVAELGKLGATALGLVILLGIFFVLNIGRAAAAMQREADSTIERLRKELNDEAARQAAINVLWDLRSTGITLRNRHVVTAANFEAWQAEYETWRESILSEAGKVNVNLRHFLARLDRMAEGPPDVIARVVGVEHGRLVRIMSEMLQRLQRFLVRDLHA